MVRELNSKEFISRHALKDSLERAFRPAIAAVVAFMDPQMNMKLGCGDTLTAQLWIKIFSVCHNLGLNFDRLTTAAAGANPSSVSCLSHLFYL